MPPPAPPSEPAATVPEGAAPAARAPGASTDAAARAPRSPWELFRVFNRLALQGFGGVLPIAQRELVERERWLTREQFVELLSVAQVLPGPNVVNLSLMFGDRAFGWRGGLAALGGMLAAPLAIVLALTALYTQFAQHPVVAGALRGMGAAAAGLILATGIKLLPALRRNALGMPAALAFAALTFAAVGLARVPLFAVLAVFGAVSCAWAWARLKP
jgi:chromate transporter